MKSIRLLMVLIIAFLSASELQAQNKDNRWAIFIGANAVDFYPAGSGTQDDLWSKNALGGLLETKRWNYVESLSQVNIGRYLGSGFSIKADFAISRLEQIGDINLPSEVNGKSIPKDASFISIDTEVVYSFKEDFNSKWFDPYLGVGPGYYFLDEDGVFSANLSGGFNFWFTDRIALTIETTYKNSFEDNELDLFQHSGGITVLFGGTKSD